jgi:hypothetical protein
MEFHFVYMSAKTDGTETQIQIFVYSTVRNLIMGIQLETEHVSLTVKLMTIFL